MKVIIEHKGEGSPIFAKWILLKIDNEEIPCKDSFEVLDNVAKKLGMKIETITVKKLT